MFCSSTLLSIDLIVPISEIKELCNQLMKKKNMEKYYYCNDVLHGKETIDGREFIQFGRMNICFLKCFSHVALLIKTHFQEQA